MRLCLKKVALRNGSQEIISEGNMPARTASKPHYASFKKYNKADEAIDGLQLAKRPDGISYNDARYRVEFDTFQHIDEIKIPKYQKENGEMLTISNL